MDINRGDRVVIDGRSVGRTQRAGEVTSTEGSGEHRRIWVKWDDGHETMLVPGSDLRVESGGLPSP